MDEVRLEKLIEETLSTMDPVEVPKDLHFDAAKIMRLARMEEEAEAERTPAPVSFADRIREMFQSRSWTRFAAAAAAFVVLLGVYGIWKGGTVPPVVPDNDPAHSAEIDDQAVPTAPPDEPIVIDEPEDPDEPVVPDEQEGPGETEVAPEPSVTPVPPTQSAQNPPKPNPPQPVTPAPVPETEGEEPVVEDEPSVEEEPGEVDNPTEYAGGKEIDPDEEPEQEEPPAEEQPGEEPEEEPGEQTGEDAPDAAEDDVFENMLQEALQDESFKAKFDEADKGFGHSIQDVQEVPEGTEFMVYFYESEEEQLSGTVNEEDIRSILWEKESL